MGKDSGWGWVYVLWKLKYPKDELSEALTFRFPETVHQNGHYKWFLQNVMYTVTSVVLYSQWLNEVNLWTEILFCFAAFY